MRLNRWVGAINKGWEQARGAWGGDEGRARERVTGRPPTPIYVSPRVLALIIVVAVGSLALVLYAAPTVPVVALGGMALAIVLSFPVRALSHVMPRGLAILVTVLTLVGAITIVFALLWAPVTQQLNGLILRIPDIANRANQSLIDVINALYERNLLPGSDPQRFGRELVADLFDRAQNLTENLLRGIVGFIPRAFGFGIALFGVLFVAVYLLADVRKVKAAYLKAAPARYRHDARDLWDAFGESLSRYLGGLTIVVAIQGSLSGLALYLLGVPYAVLCGLWVSATAIIPYLGPILGAIPALVLAIIFERPIIVIATLVVYVLIQQLEGNFLTPRIQGNALHVHPIIVLLAVIGGGELAGLAGVVFAVPAVAVLRVFFDFLRVRLRTNPDP